MNQILRCDWLPERVKWSHLARSGLSNPVPLPDLYFDSFSYPVASIVFSDMAIVSLFPLLFF